MTLTKKSKTETIKQRTIYIYLPSEKMVGRWKSLAKNGGVSVSKFVQEHVENSLIQEEDDSTFSPRKDLNKRVISLEREISGLTKENRMLKALVDKLDTEVKGYRELEFLDGSFQGVRRYDTRLVDLLRRKGAVSAKEIFSLLGVDIRDTSSTLSINKQLEALEAYGVVETYPGGWRWRG